MLSRKTYFYFPLLNFIFAWFVVFFIYFLTPIKFFPLSYETVFILLVSIILIVSGYFFYRLFFIESGSILYKQDISNPSFYIRYSLLSKIILVLSGVIISSLITYLIIISKTRGGITEYFANPIIGRQIVVETNTLRGWKLPLAVSSYGISLISLTCIIAGVLFSADKIVYKFVSLFPIIIAFSYSIITFSRYNFFSLCLYWLFSVFFISYYLNNKKRVRVLRQLIISGAVILIIILITSYLIVSLRFFTLPKKISTIFIEQINYYIIGNIIALNKYLSNDISLTWGGSLLRTIFKWLARLGLYESTQVIPQNYEFVKINNTMVSNTYSYVRTLYEDFGIIGLLNLSFFWGISSGFITQLFLNKFQFKILFFVVLMTTSFLMSFYGFYFILISKILYEFFMFYLFDKIFLNKLIISRKINVS